MTRKEALIEWILPLAFAGGIAWGFIIWGLM
jgi:hypothetical protein